MKTILASLTNLERTEGVMNAAAELAALYDSHVIGHYPIPAGFTLAISDPGGSVPFDDSVKKLYESHLPAIKDRFESLFSKSGLSYDWRDEQRSETLLTKATLAHGRQCDIIILGQDEAGSRGAIDSARFISDIILGAGRPVLVVPPGIDPIKFKRIAIGWNASREACRAAFDSLPILQKADDVFLAWVNPEKKPDKAGKLPGAELAAALARHDVNVTAQGLSNRKKHASALAEYVQANKIDLLVLGAYGHMRLREQILGGVTEHFVKNLTCPVLFSN